MKIRKYLQIESIKYPLITQKAIQLVENNQYTFIVDPKTTKPIIKQTIEFLFQVKVIKINTCRLPEKKAPRNGFYGVKPRYKKAIVKLAKGNVINLFDN